MEITQPLPLLGGLSAAQFMRRYWQKKPLLVRQAIPAMVPPIDRSALFALAEREEVESRLIRHGKSGWSLKHGPLPRRALPPLKQPAWTLLVQGVDLHHDGVHDLLRQFRFLPDARLDDLMISYASDTGGVGAHFDSYDVFLLQAQGRRRWSIGKQGDLRLQPDVPLKILENFEPEETFVLEPGDMLYLPPKYAHEGVAVGEDCMTFSIGLRSSALGELGADLLARMAQAYSEDLEDAGPAELTRYRDPTQPAVDAPAAMPAALQDFARKAVEAALRDPDAIARALGESLTEPKANIWFDEGGDVPDAMQHVALDRRTRMLYDTRHIYINGESFRAGGADAALMRKLADRRALGPRELARASEGALALLGEWCEAGWVHAD
ncbi:50S ribosomal protein L16 3-hydroxylase [Variovorax boronicumulans]|uniref:50S ribosomal protein L16 3-hydroxylase n=1 Tax=Variovorax boronicumulans TaxID=436515 RepID=A0AAW8D427_9BURK|nr:cupin domain-containing protein [Variovorax boronicumulans]MDP9895508.1 50S ribosomal protein L16 3-hydroxylase [Variovorax boronicumulans]MDQ0055548.1 50S ribosomal protein L16 3-hydroxylase [Variovorax boronicumulans]